jgi:heme-degrading monooxygenase HmoA
MSAETYDQVASGVVDSQTQAHGFIAHYAIVDDGGVTVFEIWESIDDHDAWFNPTVRPHLPADMPEPEFSEIHFSNTK